MIRERILLKANEQFKICGIKNTTMDSIAKSTGMSKRTLYENFKDNKELLKECIIQFAEDNKIYADRVLETSENVIEAILMLCKRGAEQSRDMRFNVVDDINKYYPEIYKEQVENGTKEKIDWMKKIIERGISEGVFRADLNPEIVAYMFTRQTSGLDITDQNLDKYSLHDIIENVMMLYLRGLCTHSGIEILEKSTIKNNNN